MLSVSNLVIKLQLENGSIDCDEVWRVFRDKTVVHITQVIGRVNLHVHVCASRFGISGMAGRVSLSVCVR